MKEVLKVEGGTYRLPGDELTPVTKLLTWDSVNVFATELGKSLGVDDLLLDNSVKSITIRMEAGTVGYLDVECYGTKNDVKRRTRGKPASKAAIQENSLFQDGPSFYVVRFPLMSLSATAFGPLTKGKLGGITKR